MKIVTYENTVKHGIIDKLGRKELARGFSESRASAQRIVTASLRNTQNEDENAERSGAEQMQQTMRSAADALRETVAKGVQKVMKEESESRAAQVTDLYVKEPEPGSAPVVPSPEPKTEVDPEPSSAAGSPSGSSTGSEPGSAAGSPSRSSTGSEPGSAAERKIDLLGTKRNTQSGRQAMPGIDKASMTDGRITITSSDFASELGTDVVETGTKVAGNGAQSAAQESVKATAKTTTQKAAATTSKKASETAVKTAVSTAKAAGTTAKATASASAGAASGGMTLAAQAAYESLKKSTVGVVQKVQEGVKANASGGNTAGSGELLKAQSIQSYQAVRQEYGEQAQPKGAIKLILCLCLAVFTLFSMLFSSCAVLAGAYSQSQTGHAVHINRRVQSYRPLIVRWAEADGVSAYVDVLLALCMAESGVATNPGDPFQCSESGYNTRYPHAPNSITDYKYSIEIGVLTFAKSIEYAGCTSPSDRNRLFKALQAYNMGPGFIDFCNARYNGVWSFECAKAFSDYMGGHYGNPNYINQFLEFYEFGALLPGADTADEYTGTPNPAGLCWPLGNIGRDCITQHYGGMFSGEPHRGMDIGVAHGTPIYAAAAGTVSVANSTDSWGYSWGYYVKIKHSEVHDTLYAHMSRVVVTQGQTVQQGQLIGYVGNTGNSFGAHLHFELYLNGTRVDPEPYIDTDKITEYLCSHT